MTQIDFRTAMEFTYGEPRELAPGVLRLVARNPGPFTFKGTNTYLVGTTELAVIDPGPEDAAHLQAILRTAAGRPIARILVTHTHRDHVDGLEALQAATGATTCGFGREPPASASVARGTGIPQTPAGGERFIAAFRPGMALREADTVRGPGWALTALHTPGHAPDHLCFALEGRRILFSGDHVMAWNTSVVAPPEGRMADYLASLERLIGRGDEVYLPGHGGRLENPERMVKAYLVHRTWREQAILGAIKAGAASIAQVVPAVYAGLDEKLVAAASLSVQAHVEHLIERGLLRNAGPLTFETPLHAVQSP